MKTWINLYLEGVMYFDVPQSVIDEWSKNCHCCQECTGPIPCDSVMAGGPCERICECDEDEEWDEHE